MSKSVAIFRLIDTGELFVRVASDRYMLAVEWFDEGGRAEKFALDEVEHMKTFMWSELDQAESYIYDSD